MESLRRAERLRVLQAANHRRLIDRGISAGELPSLIREACKVSGSAHAVVLQMGHDRLVGLPAVGEADGDVEVDRFG